MQIERASALEAVDAIAALDDVDALLMGPADLSADLGCELDLDGPRLREAAERVAAAAARHGKTAALHMARAEQAAGVPGARLHDALVHVRERDPRRRIVGRGARLEKLALKSSSHSGDRPIKRLMRQLRQQSSPPPSAFSRTSASRTSSRSSGWSSSSPSPSSAARTSRRSSTQIAFSAKERVGIRVIDPAGDLLGRPRRRPRDRRARRRRRRGRCDALDARLAAVKDAVAKVDAAVAADGAELALDVGLERAARLDRVDARPTCRTASPTGPQALGELTTGAAALIVKAGDTSNLILDPDLDSFYVMDALVTKVAGHAHRASPTRPTRPCSPRSTRDHALDHRIDLALTQGAVMSATEAGVAGLETSYAKTADTTLEQRPSAANVTGAAGATEKAAEGLTALVRDGNADSVDPAALDARDRERDRRARRARPRARPPDRDPHRRLHRRAPQRRDRHGHPDAARRSTCSSRCSMAIRQGTGRMRARLASLGEHEATDLRDGLAAIAAGNLTHAVATTTAPIERGSRDEIGDLEEAVEGIRADTAASIERYNAMREQIAAMLRDIASGSQVVAAASERVASTSEQASIGRQRDRPGRRRRRPRRRAAGPQRRVRPSPPPSRSSPPRATAPPPPATPPTPPRAPAT